MGIPFKWFFNALALDYSAYEGTSEIPLAEWPCEDFEALRVIIRSVLAPGRHWMCRENPHHLVAVAAAMAVLTIRKAQDGDHG